MADGAMVIVWGDAVRGRELQSLEVFREAVGYYEKQRKAGEVETFQAVELEPGGGDLCGLMLITGDPERLARMRESEEHIRLVNRTSLVVEHLGVRHGATGKTLDRIFDDWGKQAAALATTKPTIGAPTYTPA